MTEKRPIKLATTDHLDIRAKDNPKRSLVKFEEYFNGKPHAIINVALLLELGYDVSLMQWP